MSTRPNVRGLSTDVTRTSDGPSCDSRAQRERETETSTTTSSRTEPQRRNDRSDERESTTSRIRRITEADALTRLVCAIRPEWSIDDVHAWALRDERPTADVIAAGIAGARDRSIRQVGGLAFAGPAAATVAQTYPTVTEALAANDVGNLCDHGSRAGACPMCRRGAA